jgi:AraC-like DNA-binding protein
MKPKNGTKNPSIKTYAFKAGLSHELELNTLRETLRRAVEIVSEPHRADFYHIIWVQEGRSKPLLDFQEMPMPSNSLLCINKNQVLMYDRSGGYDGKVIRFTDGFFIRNEGDAKYLRACRLFDGVAGHPLVSLSKDQGVVGTLFEQIERELAHPLDNHQKTILQNLLHNLLMHCERCIPANAKHQGKPSPAKDIAQRFMDGVENGYRGGKRVSEYAQEMGVTEKRLQAATAQIFGKAPKALIDARVAMEAKRMLLYSSATIKEISYELGFDEETNFIKYFRKQAGTTPAGVRSRYLT